MPVEVKHAGRIRRTSYFESQADRTILGGNKMKKIASIFVVGAVSVSASLSEITLSAGGQTDDAKVLVLEGLTGSSDFRGNPGAGITSTG